ncbi:MAG: hypothetical protein HKM07_06050 [Chlamydiae bacterium]|nr:hypothetical protein [Chlamydiota bacterium]
MIIGKQTSVYMGTTARISFPPAFEQKCIQCSPEAHSVVDLLFYRYTGHEVPEEFIEALKKIERVSYAKLFQGFLQNVFSQQDFMKKLSHLGKAHVLVTPPEQIIKENHPSFLIVDLVNRIYKQSQSHTHSQNPHLAYHHLIKAFEIQLSPLVACSAVAKIPELQGFVEGMQELEKLGFSTKIQSKL